MSGRDIVLTGVPRSGTTLCCRILGKAADTVALFEPMDVGALSQERGSALAQVGRFFASSRDSLRNQGAAWSQQVDGQVPDNPFGGADAGGRRRHLAERALIRPGKPLSEGFNLVVKHNAAFTALLPELAVAFETWAVVRNPLAVLASWHSVDLPVTKGRLPAGERLDRLLGEALDARDELVSRQLYILDWLFARYRTCLSMERVIPYEEVVATGGSALAEAVGVTLPSMDLHERNASRLYDPQLCEHLADRLLRDDGAWRSWYGDDDVTGLLGRMQGGA